MRLAPFAVALGIVAVGASLPLGAAESPHVSAASPIEAGRFLVRYGGCNDCHTPGYSEAGGALPESSWLTGNPEGFKGPWGTLGVKGVRTPADLPPQS
jgi:mono/diheme cytochrome c family protein